MPLLIHTVLWWLVGLRVGAQAWGGGEGEGWFSLKLTPVLIALGFVMLVATWLAGHKNMKGRQQVISRLESLDLRLLTPLIGLAGFIVASSAVSQRHSCMELLRSAADSSAVWARFESSPSGSGSIRAQFQERIEFPRCRVSGWVRVKRNAQVSEPTESAEYASQPEIGSVVRVTGKAFVTRNTLRMDDAQYAEVASISSAGSNLASSLIRWRAHIGNTIDALFQERSPLVRALLIADQDDIPRDLRDMYADAGLVHMLSVSGMHVAIIASALLALGTALRMRRRWVEIFSFAVVVFYVALLGFPPPAVRSAVMLVVIAVAALMQRPIHEWTALALGAVVPTLNPLVVTDLGWQLSVGGMAALVAARAFRRHWRKWAAIAVLKYRPNRYRNSVQQSAKHRESKLYSIKMFMLFAIARAGLQRGLGGWITQEMFTGLVATLVTAPVIAWTFGRVSIIAPLSNLPAGAIIALLQPALFLTIIVSPVSTSLASFLADATQPMMVLLDVVASASARVPGAVIPVAPTLLTAFCAALAAGCIVRGSASRRQGPWWLGAFAIVVVSLWIPLLRGGTGKLEMHVLDVGQGDAIAMRTPRGHWIMFDAGPRSSRGDAARRVIVPYVRRLGGDVVLFVLSHAHDDHAGGAATLVRLLKPALWWEPAFVTSSPGYAEALEAVSETGTRWERARPGDSIAVDGVVLHVLASDSAWTAAQQNANETSVVVRVDYGSHRFLFTGDAEREEENWLLERWGEDYLRADVLKVGHHGSRTSSSEPFLDAVRPRLAVASLGAGNRYRHPAPETVGAFLDRSVPLLRTDLEGTIIVRSDGHHLEVESKGERWVVGDH